MQRILVGPVLAGLVLLAAIGSAHGQCAGDIDCSGTVDGADLALLAADFGTTGCGSCDDVLARVEDLENQVAALQELLQFVSREGNDMFITGANLHIRSGAGRTNLVYNGLGNLIVGYNEPRYGGGDERSGSHNVVIGTQNNYSSYGGIVVGYGSEISGTYASVTGGIANTASGEYASVSGGRFNEASGHISSISGGDVCVASGQYATIGGGESNTADGWASHVSGGRNNLAQGACAAVVGGGGSDDSDGNTAFANYSAVLGGWRNIAGDPTLTDAGIGPQSVVSAGSSNIASGDRAAVSGGYNNTATGAGASVSGGRLNHATAIGATVGGGSWTTVSDDFDWAAGDLYEAD